MKKIIIYCDGACRGNPGPGGWGVLLIYGDKEKTLSGFEENTTNNRMELTAAISALQALRENCHVDVYTDSQYVQKGISEWIKKWKKNNWKTSNKKLVKNADLWQVLDELSTAHKVHWHWVKGHSDHPENDRVDELANLAIDKGVKCK